jgi:FkbM family methyltransferase
MEMISNHGTPLVIYDVGSNKGDNLPYYFLKAHKVVAVEANPALVRQIKAKYKSEIDKGLLVVEDCVVTAERGAKEVDFYIHNFSDVHSQLPPPTESQAGMFQRVTLHSKNIVDIIRDHGAPHYIKIDIEHYDSILLRELFENRVFPSYISAEFHSADVFLQLASVGGYKAFKLVNGRTVSSEYSKALIHNIHSQSEQWHSFLSHSAGPFGNDIKDDWFDIVGIMMVLGLEGTGWKDIHCSRIDSPISAHPLRWRTFLDRSVAIGDLLDYVVKRMRSSALRIILGRS